MSLRMSPSHKIMESVVSIKALNWAFEQELPCATKFVLVALADSTNTDLECWPSQRTIAKRCGLTRQKVNVAIKDLADYQLISVEHRQAEGGGQVSNFYRLNLRFTAVNEDDTVVIRESGECHSGLPPESSSVSPGVNEDDSLIIEPTNEPPIEPTNEPIGKKARKTSLPDDCPTRDDSAKAIAYWTKHGRPDIDAQEQAQLFRDHHVINAKTSADWSASWRTWYVRARAYTEKRKGQAENKIVRIQRENLGPG